MTLQKWFRLFLYTSKIIALFTLYNTVLSSKSVSGTEGVLEEIRGDRIPSPPFTLNTIPKDIIQHTMSFMDPEDWIRLSMVSKELRRKVTHLMRYYEAGQHYYLSRVDKIYNYKPSYLEPPGWGEITRASIAVRYLHYAVLSGALLNEEFSADIIKYMNHFENFKGLPAFKRRNGDYRLEEVKKALPAVRQRIRPRSRTRNFLKYEVAPYALIAIPVAIGAAVFYCIMRSDSIEAPEIDLTAGLSATGALVGAICEVETSGDLDGDSEGSGAGGIIWPLLATVGSYVGLKAFSRWWYGK